MRLPKLPQRYKHPSPFSTSVVQQLDLLLPSGIFLDPFAGTGKVYELMREDRAFVGIEIEAEWALMAEGKTLIGDARDVLRDFVQMGTRFDGVVTSPVYGNRMSDHHDARDGSERRSYTHDLGRKLTEGNAGTMYFWQEEYRDLHREVWDLCFQVTRPEGRIWLNVSDFIREGNKQPVVSWHMVALQGCGWKIEKIHKVPTPRMRYGENGEARVDGERIIQARKP